jgi:hypothetical protein
MGSTLESFDIDPTGDPTNRDPTIDFEVHEDVAQDAAGTMTGEASHTGTGSRLACWPWRRVLPVKYSTSYQHKIIISNKKTRHLPRVVIKSAIQES